MGRQTQNIRSSSTAVPVRCVVVTVDRDDFYLQEKAGETILRSFPPDLRDDPCFLFSRSPNWEHLVVGDEIEVGYDFANYASGPICWLSGPEV